MATKIASAKPQSSTTKTPPENVGMLLIKIKKKKEEKSLFPTIFERTNVKRYLVLSTQREHIIFLLVNFFFNKNKSFKISVEFFSIISKSKIARAV